ncbi:MAG: hypothetical protein J6Y78_06125 [Paludibacteraceae bacterium]|nr:hypothetical protein [Paludibacteraceae bacterium]
MEDLVMNISKDVLIKNPKGGMTIAFRYADEDGNLDDFIRLGYIYEWDTTDDSDMGTIVTIFYLDVALLDKSGKIMSNSNELHCEFYPDRMSEIRLATVSEIKLLSSALVSSRTLLMIEEQEDAFCTLKTEEWKKISQMQNQVTDLQKKVKEDCRNMIESIMSKRDAVNLEEDGIFITTSGCEGEYRDQVVNIYKYIGILKLETKEGGREPLGNVSSEEMFDICSALRSKC